MCVYVFKNSQKERFMKVWNDFLKVLVRIKHRIPRARKNNCCYLVYEIYKTE